MVEKQFNSYVTFFFYVYLHFHVPYVKQYEQYLKI